MKKSGFTLIELLVVVLIIGILATVAVPQYQKITEKSRAAEAIAMISSLGRATERYYQTHLTYPEDFDLLDIKIDGERTHLTAINDKHFSYDILAADNLAMCEATALRINPSRDNVGIDKWAKSAFAYTYIFCIHNTSAPYAAFKPGNVYCAVKNNATPLQKGVCASYGKKVTTLPNGWSYYGV